MSCGLWYFLTLIPRLLRTSHGHTPGSNGIVSALSERGSISYRDIGHSFVRKICYPPASRTELLNWKNSGTLKYPDLPKRTLRAGLASQKIERVRNNKTKPRKSTGWSLAMALTLVGLRRRIRERRPVASQPARGTSQRRILILRSCSSTCKTT